MTAGSAFIMFVAAGLPEKGGRGLDAGETGHGEKRDCRKQRCAGR